MVLRRKISIALMILGAAVMLLAPTGTKEGIALILVGFVIECVGLAVERKAQ